MSKHYFGHPGGTVNVVDGARGRAYALPPRLDLRDHLPTGFAWGYGGSGPAQLALAVLADALDDQRALKLYQDFKWAVIAPLTGGAAWELTFEQVCELAAAVEQETNDVA